MAGIYIHIPFCKQACHYCDFHFSTSLKNKDALLEAVSKELVSRKDYLAGEKIETIYFGGGTPSLLSTEEISRFLKVIYKEFLIISVPEITLEANPDDLNLQKLKDLKEIGINRLSIGIQSVYDEDLQFMNRAHNSKEAIDCIKNARELGFNLSIDLIYGTPFLTNDLWEKQLEEVINWNVPHLSCYSLTIEEKTALASFIKNKKIKPLDDEKSKEQFLILLDVLQKHGYEHYEISNFCKKGHYAKHNTAYWQQKKYLGVGPSAHSYNKIERCWNISNNSLYISKLQKGEEYFETEKLTEKDKFNEYVLTTLRTQWGCSEVYIKRNFSEYFESFEKNISKFVKNGLVDLTNSTYTLTTQGKLVADKIAGNLFLVN